MHKPHIKRIYAENFMSFGVLDIDFSKYGNIILVQGENRDDKKEKASNGAGKTTLFEAIAFGLFGNVVKDLNNRDVLNRTTKKNLKIEVEFNDCRVVRTLTNKKTPVQTLKLFENGKDITRTIPQTQADIEERLGMGFEAFVNTCFFGEHNYHSFLTCNAATRRLIVENLLDLGRFSKMLEKAKDQRHTIQAVCAENKIKLESINTQQALANSRLSVVKEQEVSWFDERDSELKRLAEREKELVSQINSLDETGEFEKYEAAQKRLTQLDKDIITLSAALNQGLEIQQNQEGKVRSVEEKRKSIEAEIRAITGDYSVAKSDLSRLQTELKQVLAMTPGAQCPECFHEIHEENCSRVADSIRVKIEKAKSSLETIQIDFDGVDRRTKEIDSEISLLRKSIRTLVEQSSGLQNKLRTMQTDQARLQSLRPPIPGERTKGLQTELNRVRDRLGVREKEENPYSKLVLREEAELVRLIGSSDQIKAEYDASRDEFRYWDFWVSGLGDKGVRAFIIDGILSPLNGRINYWLQFLMDGSLTVNFDRCFEATLGRNPPDEDPFVFSATSGGERRRVNLAISQAFAHLMMLSTGTFPSLMILDEVSLNVDEPGCHAIYRMLTELAQDRQVFVTTHDRNLLDLLQGCDTIRVVKEHGVSKID